MYRDIPTGAVEVQEGLYLLETPTMIGNTPFTFRELFSFEGYCFWEVNQPENYNEEGELLPLENRIFATYSTCAYTTVEDINANFISVPYQEGYEAVSVSNNDHEVM